ncbi:MAG: DUF1080 domain-containing protein [Bacteroidetes bacterium]|nr:DUF1080 domain-containing protein [Bacteroidota bacterium]MDA1332674.1 DUF1080 domain-containing protein [Bacteroidota bacterium]
MARIPVFLFLALFLSSCSTQDAPSPGADIQEWEQLFNGASLDGWTPKIRGSAWGEDPRQSFRVEDGSITVSYDQYDRFEEEFGHLFYEKPFSWYVLGLEYRFLGDQVEGGPGWAYRNSGVMIHSPPGESMTIDQDFPISIEVQLLGGNGTDDRSTANLCTPGTHVEMNGELETRHCINSTSQTYHGDGWVRADILVLGDSLISHKVDGGIVLEYEHPQMGGGNVNGHDPAQKQDGKMLTSGYLSLQSESHPVQFRKVELLNLEGCMDTTATNYKSYFLFSDQDACAYGQ